MEAIVEACPEGAEVGLLSGRYMTTPEQFVVSDLASIKGFEFTQVLIVGADEGILPAPEIPIEERWREVRRLYVAITRGRDEVHLFHSGKPTPLLQGIEGYFDVH
ncbi:MAG: 3'-5' exonuclease [Verrucomicrobiota bacterium]